MRAGKELRLPSTAIPLGPDDEREVVSRERHTGKTSPAVPTDGREHWREAVRPKQ